MIALWAATRSGVTVSPDSVGYIAAARNLSSGRGLSVPRADGRSIPVTAVPPLYSTILAGSIKAGLDVFTAVRVLNVALLGGSIFLAAALIGEAIHGATKAPGPGGSLFLAAPLAVLVTSSTVLSVFASAWSEPLFIFLSMAAFTCLRSHLRTGHPRPAIAAGMAAGAAWLARYVGVAVVMTGAVAILVGSRSSRGRMIRTLAIYLLLSCLPMALWLLRNILLDMPATGRSMQVHLLSAGHLRTLRYTVSEWLVPERLNHPLRAVLVVSSAALAVLFAAVAARTNRARQKAAVTLQAGQLMVVFTVIYLSVLAASISLVDFATPLDYRILAPVFIPLLIALTAAVAAELGRASLTPAMAGALALLLAAVLMCHAAAALAWIRVSGTGYWAGYAGREWQQAGTMAWLNSQPQSAHIYTNGTEPIYLHTGRVASRLPVKSDEAASLHPGSVVVFFHHVAWEGLGERELQRLLPLRLEAQYPEAAVYTLGARPE